MRGCVRSASEYTIPRCPRRLFLLDGTKRVSWGHCALFSTPVLLEAAPMRQQSKGGVDRRILTGLDGEPRASRVLEMWRRTVAAAGVGKPSSLWCEGSACDWRTNWTARFHAAGGACQWGLRPALRRTEWAVEPGEPMGLASGRRFHSGMLGCYHQTHSLYLYRYRRQRW